jgi:hypothetical protein
LAAARGRLDEALTKDLRDAALGQELYAMVRRRLAEVTARCANAIATVTQMTGFPKYGDALREARQVVGHMGDLLDDGGIDAVAELVREYKFDKVPSVSAGTPGKEIVQRLLKGIREDITAKEGSLASILRFDTAQWVEGLRAIRPHVEVFLSLVEEFGRRYAAAKQAQRALDFADLERLALRALRDGASPALAPSAVARLQHRRFKHVLVDEYQDINVGAGRDSCTWSAARHQRAMARAATVFTCRRREAKHLRGFRLAEPNAIPPARRALRSRKDVAARGSSISRQISSSRAPHLAALRSRVFSTLMTRQAAGHRIRRIT